MRMSVWSIAATLIAVTALAQVTVSGGKGAKLDSIAGSDTVVTVVLKAGARDPNLKVTGVFDDYFSVEATSGEKYSYKYDDVASVEVQGAVIPVRKVDLLESRGLTNEQRDIVDRAMARISETFTTSPDQSLKMRAAMLLMVAGDSEAKQVGADYLGTLRESNDLRTSLAAVEYSFLAGADGDYTTVVANGLASGERKTKGKAAILAGLTGLQSAVTQLNTMAQDRAAEIAIPGVLGLAHLGNRDNLPLLLSMINERNEDRSEAAKKALVLLGGDDVIESLGDLLPKSEGLSQFRIAEALHRLGDERGTRKLENDYLSSLVLQHSAAVVLAQDGDPRAMQILRDRLADKRFDPLPEILTRRAEAAAALLKAGDRTNIGVFQELLRLADPEIELSVYRHLSKLGMPSLLPICLPGVESQEPARALNACQAVVAIANSDFRKREEMILAL
ncbi:MAG: hypothetical protein AMXMBFR84_22860 [Candidatus Hydrogenedentota bacterium]